MGTEHPRPVALRLEDVARLVGAYVWAERRLFEVLGAFAGSETSDEAALFFDTRAQHHAWHAELLAEQLPLLAGVDHATLTVAPSAGAAGTVDALAAAGGTLPRLAGLGRVVLPRLVAGYQAHLSRSAPVADAPLARALGLVVHDELDALQAAEALLERAGAADPAGLAAAAAGLAGLESGLAGVGPGIVGWPGGAPDQA